MDTVNENVCSFPNGSLNVGFIAHAAYYDALDCIEYVREDCTMIAERVDELLTLFRKNNTTDYIGFKVKGFRNYFERVLLPEYGLNEDDFLTLKTIMESICHERAPTILSNSVDKSDKVAAAYKLAYEMANREAVRLSGFRVSQAA